MSELSEDHLSEQDEPESTTRSFRGFLCLAFAAVAIPVCFSLLNSSESDTGIDIPLSQLEKDLAGEEEASEESRELPEPGRLVTDATATAIKMPGQSSMAESDGPLFGDPLSTGSLPDSTRSEDGAASIEVTRFRPTPQRAQANQAVWLTGSIEPID